jgi:hypothetical protein
MSPKRIGKPTKTVGLMPKISGGTIFSRSRKILDHSAANLKKGLASAPINLSAFRKPYVNRATKRLRR